MRRLRRMGLTRRVGPDAEGAVGGYGRPGVNGMSASVGQIEKKIHERVLALLSQCLG